MAQAAKSRTTRSAGPVQPIRLVNGRRSHHVRNCIFGMLAWVFALASLLGTATHILPESIQAWPYMPVVVSLVPWFALLAIVADMVAVSVLLQSDETASRRDCRGFRRFHEHG